MNFITCVIAIWIIACNVYTSNTLDKWHFQLSKISNMKFVRSHHLLFIIATWSCNQHAIDQIKGLSIQMNCLDSFFFALDIPLFQPSSFPNKFTYKRHDVSINVPAHLQYSFDSDNGTFHILATFDNGKMGKRWSRLCTGIQ